MRYKLKKTYLYVEVKPIQVLDHQIKRLKGKDIYLVKVLWDAKTKDSTWELMNDMKKVYTNILSGQ